MGQGARQQRVATGPRRADADGSLAALTTSIRRYAGSLGLPSHDIDDVAQETLARVLHARGHLDSDAVVGYCLVVARNLVRDLRRVRRREIRSDHVVPEGQWPDQPAEAFEAQEERRALAAALAELPDEQRVLLLAHDLHGQPLRELAGDRSLPALAAQLSRTRARVRVDYLVHRRSSPLPTPRCRPVLLTLASGDRHRQSQLNAGTHLVHCSACAELAPALLRREHAAAWLVLPAAVSALGLLRRAGRWLGRPGPALATGTAAVAAGALVLVAVTGKEAPAAGVLTDPRGSLLRHSRDLGPDIGLPVRARGVTVLAVPSDEGFWVGRGTARVWVQLTGRGESPQRVTAGMRLSFRGTVVRNRRGFVAGLGLSPHEGAAELRRAAHHVAVPAAALRLRPPADGTPSTRRHRAGAGIHVRR
jgi:RNA polymerase sigma factor (sigma-70 family)